LGTRVKKEVCALAGHHPLFGIVLTTSTLISSQNPLKKPKLYLSRPGLFLLSQFQTTTFVSYSSIFAINISLSASVD